MKSIKEKIQKKSIEFKNAIYGILTLIIMFLIFEAYFDFIFLKPLFKHIINLFSQFFIMVINLLIPVIDFFVNSIKSIIEFTKKYPKDTVPLIAITTFNGILLSILYPEVLKIEREGDCIIAGINIGRWRLRKNIISFFPTFIAIQLFFGILALFIEYNNSSNYDSIKNQPISDIGQLASWCLFLFMFISIFLTKLWIKSISNRENPANILADIRREIENVQI